MTDTCQAAGDAFVNGLMSALVLGLPAIGAVLYGVIFGLSTSQRARRAYQRRLNRLAADYMALGYPPDSYETDAYDLAKRQLRKEADDAMKVLA